jgi:hypothetical protein
VFLFDYRAVWPGKLVHAIQFHRQSPLKAARSIKRERDASARLSVRGLPIGRRILVLRRQTLDALLPLVGQLVTPFDAG